MKASDGFFGAVDSIEPDSGEHDFSDRAVDIGAGVEFFDHNVPGVTEFEGVESRPLGDFEFTWFGDFGGWMVCFEPFLVGGVEFFDGEG